MTFCQICLAPIPPGDGYCQDHALDGMAAALEARADLVTKVQEAAKIRELIDRWKVIEQRARDDGRTEEEVQKRKERFFITGE